MAAAAGPDLLSCPSAQRILTVLCQLCRLDCTSDIHTGSTKRSLWATAEPCSLSWEKKEKILDLKDRLNIQTVDFEYGLREKSHKVPFEQREPTYGRCGKEVEIKYTAYVTFISFSFNLQVMN